MDIMKLFEEYLPRWSNEKHLPIPTTKHMDRWLTAWGDFTKEELPKHYEGMRQEYINMRVKTKDMMLDELREQKEIELNKQIENETKEEKEEKPQSEWDKIRKLLGK